MAQTLQRTPLHDRHVALGARMVPFAGWEMPVQYEGVIQEHRAVRTDAGVFDVSHMGEIEVEGPRAHELLQGLLSNDLDRLEPGEAQYTLLTNERGGIVDDLIAYRLERVPLPARRQRVEPRGRLRLAQGARDQRLRRARRLRRVRAPRRPGAERDREARARRRRSSSRSPRSAIDGVEAWSTAPATPARTAARSSAWRRTRSRSGTRCSPAASRRAGSARATRCASRRRCPLHGNDIGPDTDAISAGLGWTCALDEGLHRRRRAAPDQGGGARARKLVSFVMEEKAIPRQGMPIEGGGEVTSGTHSPMLDVGIGMGYVPAAPGGARHAADDRRARQAAQGARREETDLQEGGLSGRRGVVSRRPQVPPRARLGAHRGRRGRPRRSRGSRSDALGELVHFEPPEPGVDGDEGQLVRRGRVGEGRLRRDRAALRRGARGEPDRSSTRPRR